MTTNAPEMTDVVNNFMSLAPVPLPDAWGVGASGTKVRRSIRRSLGRMAARLLQIRGGATTDMNRGCPDARRVTFTRLYDR